MRGRRSPPPDSETGACRPSSGRLHDHTVTLDSDSDLPIVRHRLERLDDLPRRRGPDTAPAAPTSESRTHQHGSPAGPSAVPRFHRRAQERTDAMLGDALFGGSWGSWVQMGTDREVHESAPAKPGPTCTFRERTTGFEPRDPNLGKVVLTGGTRHQPGSEGTTLCSSLHARRHLPVSWAPIAPICHDRSGARALALAPELPLITQAFVSGVRPGHNAGDAA